MPQQTALRMETPDIVPLFKADSATLSFYATKAHETAPLFKADSATLSFYATKDGKISVSYQGWDQSKTVLAGQRLWSRGARGR